MVFFLSSLFPAPALAQGAQTLQVPDTIEGVKEGIVGIGDRIARAIPGAIAGIWNNQVIPVWKRMWEWTKNEVWERRVSPALESFSDRVKTLLGQEVEKRKPLIELGLEQEKEELKEDIEEARKNLGKGLWERFWALLLQPG